VPTHRDIDALVARVDELNANVARLASRGGTGRSAAKAAARKSAAKRAPRKSA
jgi:outer membrane murein-binding lipoprotein Lpp